jgi:hypothetical protein
MVSSSISKGQFPIGLFIGSIVQINHGLRNFAVLPLRMEHKVAQYGRGRSHDYELIHDGRRKQAWAGDYPRGKGQVRRGSILDVSDRAAQ